MAYKPLHEQDAVYQDQCLHFQPDHRLEDEEFHTHHSHQNTHQNVLQNHELPSLTEMQAFHHAHHSDT